MIEDLDYVGDNAFEKGFLNRNFSNDVIDRINIFPKGRVLMPPGSTGSARIFYTEENWFLDLSKLQFPSETPKPFQVTGGISGGGSPQIKVSPHSTLLKSLTDATDIVSISGLDTYYAVSAGSYVLLQIAISGYTYTASIVIGSGWVQNPSLVRWVDPSATDLVQNYAYLPIARVVNSPVSGNRAAFTIRTATANLDVIQMVDTNLILKSECLGGANIVFPYPFSQAIN